MKEQIIQIPDTLEIKEIKDGKIILVEKEKKPTYFDVINNLCTMNEELYYIDKYGFPTRENFNEFGISNGNIFKSKRQAQKLLAINMLINTAKYLNGDWHPKWNRDSDEEKYYIKLCVPDSLHIDYAFNSCCTNVYFKSRELAKQAVKILGEETIRLALCTDY